MVRERGAWWTGRLHIWACVVAFLIVAGGLLSFATAIPAQESTPGAPIGVADVAATPGAGGTPAADQPPTTAAQALADKYAPVGMLTRQRDVCDRVGEPYLPLPVEVALNDPQVSLRRDRVSGESEDPVVTTAPAAQDLVNSDDTYYLDLPGDALSPGCDYELWANERTDELGLEPSVYARVVTEEGRPGELALQYFFYWVFNDFVDNHESDWEMVQLIFDAHTPGEALEQEPAKVVFAQHSGGETASWDDTKLLRDGDHIIVYPASGSHASYYGEATWIGWGEHGSGFGCDLAHEEFNEVPLKAILVPNTIDPDGPFAWALFQGRWGERHAWVYDGPKSPNVSPRWTTPISWTDDLRDSSLRIPHVPTLGTGPTSFFCSASDTSGTIMKLYPQDPRPVVWGAIAILVGLLLASFLTWRYFMHAFGMYFRHLRVFLPISLLLIPVAAAASGIERELARFVGVGGHDVEWLSSAIEFESLARSGLIFHLALGAFIALATIMATARIARNERVTAYTAFSETLPSAPRFVGATLLNGLIVFLLSLTIIGIPFAVYRAAQWLYSPHAIILEGAGVRNARHVSRDVIKGDWLRSLGMASLVLYVAAIPGPLVGIALILLGVNIPIADFVSSGIYAAMYPITIITTTLYFLHRKQLKEARAASGQPVDAPEGRFWSRLRHPRSRDHEPEGLGPDAPAPGPAPSGS
jgi:hypothetical protein